MTREVAIGHIKDVICENNTIKPNIVVFEQEKEALYMAIKALEQEPILNKIRAEIKGKIVRRSGLNHTRYERDRNDAFLEVLDMIDKYKAESEE